MSLHMSIQYLLCIIVLALATKTNPDFYWYALGVKVSYEYVMRNRVAKNNILLITPFFFNR